MNGPSPVYTRLGLPLAGADLRDCLVLLHTNDLHGSVDAGSMEPSAGFAHLKNLKELRAQECGAVFLLDGGDTLHGRAEVHPFQGKIPLDFMLQTGYDAMVLGNHDFNYGKDRLIRLWQEYELPMLATNIRMAETKEAFLDQTLLLEKGSWRVGLFGLVSPETVIKASPRHIRGLEFMDPVASAKEAIAKLKDQGAELIVCLSHLGMDRAGPLQDDQLAEELAGIDVIIGGHSHSVLPEGLWVGETLIVQAGSYFSHVGEIRLAKDAEGRIHKQAFLHSNDAMRTVRPDVALLREIEKVGRAHNNAMDEILAELPMDLLGDRMHVRTQETNFGRLMADLIRKETGADIAIMNGGGIRSSLAAGPVRKADVHRAFPFTNYSVLVEVRGEALLEILEYGLSAYPEPAGRFPHISGAELIFDPTAPAGSRIQSFSIGGKDLKLDALYTLAINDFMAFGGDGYQFFEGLLWLDHFDPLAEIFERSLQTELFGQELNKARLRTLDPAHRGRNPMKLA